MSAVMRTLLLKLHLEAKEALTIMTYGFFHTKQFSCSDRGFECCACCLRAALFPSLLLKNLLA